MVIAVIDGMGGGIGALFSEQYNKYKFKTI